MSKLPIRLTIPSIQPPVYKEAEMVLILVTINGAYRFEGVPPEIYQGIMAAANQQDYFDRHINGKFKAAPQGHLY